MAKWEKLEHNGILFPPDFESKGIKIKIRGESVELNLEQEEMVYQWAKKKDTPYVQDKVFQRNFTADFAERLGPKFKKISYGDIDFSQAYKLIDVEKYRREAMSKEEKKEQAKKRKELREELKAEYGTAKMQLKKGGRLVEVEVGNYMAEPPGIFIGRGEHPLRGKWKPRIAKKDVILNLGKKAPKPKGDWKEIRHDQDSMWLARWTDFLTKKTKYVWLSDSSDLKQGKDREKYEKAAKLRKEIGKIRKAMVRDMKDAKKGKVATACYLIYRTAMRVGDEKGEDEADTVGATTLRKEHVKITSDQIEFDFLGKDSVRWQETLKVEGDDRQFLENLRKSIEKKKPSEDIFDKVTSRDVNRYFSGIVEGLTAKVFRTCLATTKVKDYLCQHDDIGKESPSAKIYHAKLANLEAAIMCNHKRTIPKTFEQSLQKKRDTLKKVEQNKTWGKTQETLKKVKASEPKTEAKKKNKAKRIKTLNKQIKKQKTRHRERVEKLRLQIDLSEQTRDYNLGTSLKNYIDPIVFKAWTDEVDAEWEKLYTPALQKKFLWVKKEDPSWDAIKNQKGL